MNNTANQSQIAVRLLLSVIASATMVSTVGCAKWKLDDQVAKQPEIQLTQGKMPPDSVLLELKVIEIDPTNIDLENEAWNELHPQEIELATRKGLAANGIRCGVASSSLPTPLRELIDSHEQRRRSEETQAEALMSEQTIAMKLQVRSGQPSHIVLSKTLPSLSWVVNDDGHLYGRESYNARCQYTMKARPVGEGKIRLELVPEITHGVPQQRIGVGNSSLMYEMAQDRHVLEPLKIVTRLQPGQWLVIGSTEQAAGIGEKFFYETDEAGGMRKLVLVRLDPSQPVTLSSRDKSAAPIVTPTD